MHPAAGPSASPVIASANEALRLRLPFADIEDFEDARRGPLGSLATASSARPTAASCGTPTPTASSTASARRP